MGPRRMCPSVRRSVCRATLAVAASLLPAVAGAAQSANEATLVVQRNGREVGRERFTLHDRRGQGQPGSTLVSTARYPATDPVLDVTTRIERTPELELALFQMAVDSGGASTVVWAAGTGTKLIVRTTSKGSETGRELPGSRDIVLLDDAVFAPYAQIVNLATPAGRSLTGVFPRSKRRVTFTARREQLADGTLRVTLGGELSGTLVADANGVLRTLELPGAQVSVSRVRGSR